LKEITKDTLLNPPDYKNKIVVTNPPYLAKNSVSRKHNKKKKTPLIKYEDQ
jgi:tRNA1(Val) A37 N6-methylase TrmN6